MFIARNRANESIYISRAYSEQYWVLKREKELFFCPACDREVVIKLGNKRSWHFAHRVSTSCTGKAGKETVLHERGKKMLYTFFQKSYPQTKLESYLPQTKQRPDILIEANQFVIEYQCSVISVEQIVKRNDDYHTQRLKPIWVLGSNRLKRLGASMFRLQEYEYYAIFTNNQQRYLYYFDPNIQTFCLLTNLISIHKNLILANCHFIKMEQLSPASFFFPRPSHLTAIEGGYDTFRKKASTRTLLQFPYLLTYYLQMQRQQTPPIVGWSLPAQLYFLPSPYEWQTFFIFEGLEKFPLHQTFSLTVILNQFQFMYDRYQWRVRTRCTPETVQFLIVSQYIELLISFGYLKRQRDSIYERISNAVDINEEKIGLLKKWSETCGNFK
ncbi:competence protein CoiA family protein [Shouchella sp. 1P09AA]|uniref:competence protein CoiA n=1 Tax=unclassified Shouchella TaxID=2893065 RepID=UPI0039A32BE6